MAPKTLTSLKARRHDVLIAVGQYTDNQIPPIKCCENDIQLLSSTLANIPYINGNPPVQTIVSTKDGYQRCSKTNILKIIDNTVKEIEPEDMLLLIFSCHGTSQNDETFLVPSDASIGNIDSLISFNWIKEMLDECKAKFKVILVDACHSGDSKITFKSGTMPLYFKEDTTVVDRLLKESNGIAYATSCTHEQVALIEPDEVYSIWMHAFAKALTTEGKDSDGIIRFEPILSATTSATIKAASQFWSKLQTPFYVTKVEGIMPLGITTDKNPIVRIQTDKTSVAEATTLAFQERFIDTYGRNMEVEFDETLQKPFRSNGVQLSKVVTIGPKGSRVRLGIVFDFIEEVPSLHKLFEIQELAQKYTVDRIILPSTANWDTTARRYVNQLRHIHLLQLNRTTINRNKIYHDYCQLADYDPYTSTLANEFSDVILRQMGKLFHIVLSDFAAPSYDQDYGKSSFGTSQAMHFEEDIIYSTIAKLNNRDLAIDLGCGTGRHSFILSKFFRAVDGYDFSGGMIDVANHKKRDRVLNDKVYENISFYLRDVEDNPLDLEPDSVDLVAACFGMGSFVDDLVSFLVGIKYLLHPGGKAIFSFYNKDALFYTVPPPWRDPSLSAILNPDREELEVTLPTGDKFRIFCRPYKYFEINGQLSRIFDSVQIYSSPTFASFLPGQIFLQGPQRARAREIVSSVDKELAKITSSLPIGAYFTAVCGKNDDNESRHFENKKLIHSHGERNLLQLLESSKVDYSVIEHEKVRNISDVEKVLGINPSVMAKAILTIIRPAEKQPNYAKYVVFVIQGSNKLDLEKVGMLLGKSRRQWRFATQKEVKELFGLEIGGVPPFGYGEDITVYLDARLSQLDSVYCGIGNPKKSVQIKVKDLISISRAEICDIALE